MAQFTFTGLILREEAAYSALCPELDVASVGDTPGEARSNLLEAVWLHLEGAIEDGLPSLRPVPAPEDPRQLTPEAVVETFRF
jgi:predicted RNase H-like HicB family nuclease